MSQMKTPSENVRFGFRERVAGLAIALVAVVALTAFGYVYWLSKVTLEKELRNELLATVNSIAPQIDGDHLGLKEEHARIQTILEKVASRSLIFGDDDPLYILRPTSKFGEDDELEFVALAFARPSGNP